MRCASCQAENPPENRAALEGERRQVTVLFADVARFTSLAERLDPEDVHAIIDRCFERITAEVHRFEGTINQYTGDGSWPCSARPSRTRTARGGRPTRRWGSSAASAS